MPGLADLSIYETRFCPYCVRVRSAMQRMNLDLERRDIQANSASRAELIAATGRQTVPCLRIRHSDEEVEWMHESADIIEYLEANFGS